MAMVALVGTVAAGFLGWRLIGLPIEQFDRISVTTSHALAELSDDLDGAAETIARVQTGLATTGGLLGASAEEMDQVQATLSDTAAALETDISDSLAGVAQALPALIATTSVLESTLLSLSFLGVEYAPEVPLNSALTGLEQSLSPLPDQLRNEGELLGSLAIDTAMLSGQASELGDAVVALAEDLAGTESLLVDVGRSAEAIREQIETERAQLPLLERRARVVLVIFGSALAITQLALALGAWARWRAGTTQS